MRWLNGVQLAIRDSLAPDLRREGSGEGIFFDLFLHDPLTTAPRLTGAGKQSRKSCPDRRQRSLLSRRLEYGHY